MIIITAFFHVVPGKEKELESVLKAMFPHVRKEPGVLTYNLHQNENKPDTFFFYEKYKDQGFIVLGVNTGDDNSDDGVLTFMRNSVVTFPVVRDAGNRLGGMYRINGLPTSFFVDKKGVIRDIVVGGPMTDSFIDKEWNLISQ